MKLKATTTLRFNDEVFKTLKLISTEKKANMSDIVEFALLKYYFSNDELIKEIESVLGKEIIKKLRSLLDEYNAKLG